MFFLGRERPVGGSGDGYGSGSRQVHFAASNNISTPQSEVRGTQYNFYYCLFVAFHKTSLKIKIKNLLLLTILFPICL